jgi:CheY-like chemotaxis protein
MRPTRVLVVEPDRLVRDVIARRLVAADYDVTACPGPSAPDYTCMGTRGSRCPLEAVADVVVLDADLPGEEVADAASGIDLLSYYTGMEKPTVTLRAAPQVLRLSAAEPIRNLEWPPETGALIRAIDDALSSSRASAGATPRAGC